MNDVEPVAEPSLGPLGLEILSNTPNPADRTWEPIFDRPRHRAKFATEAEAELYAARLLSTQPHLQLRIVPIA